MSYKILADAQSLADVDKGRFLDTANLASHFRRVSCCLVLTSAVLTAASASWGASATARYLDNSDGRDWPGYGRTYGQQHHSPLTQIDQRTVSRLGLAWSLDLPGTQNSATQPVEVGGVLYFALGLSVVHAVNAATGKELWKYDPKVAEKAGHTLRFGWGVRGIAWWNDRIYTGTQDGRLIAIDAKTGKPDWSVQTFDPTYPAFINSAPRVFNGRVIVGYASNVDATRGFVTAYDAQTGAQLWRFYTVPGDPAKGFENETMAMAARTWAGEWWKRGGGGDVWNALAYDVELDTVYVGTGSAFPDNHRVRSAGQGDNLFVSSIIALDARTGAYKWHYQTTPGDMWNYDATMDIQLADLVIDGRLRKVLIQAPKNGFFYVIDRLTGQLLSAKPYAKVTWASHVDLKTGRPVETPGARYPNNSTVEIWPSSMGAHGWMPMAYSPKIQMVYIPVTELGNRMNDISIWQPVTSLPNEGWGARGALVAWNPIEQRPVWKIDHPTYLNGGILATGGDLVFQGTVDGTLKAYAADTGKVLWSFQTQAPLIATPISYAVNGQQYVTLLTGLGMGAPALAAELTGKGIERYTFDPRSQARRVLTFKLGATGRLPAALPPPPPPDDPAFRPDDALAATGRSLYTTCAVCHGASLIPSSHAPDLRRSAIPLVPQVFAAIVRGGGLVSHGMPPFSELTDEQLAALRQYIRTEAENLRKRDAANRPNR